MQLYSNFLFLFFLSKAIQVLQAQILCAGSLSALIVFFKWGSKKKQNQYLYVIKQMIFLKKKMLENRIQLRYVKKKKKVTIGLLVSICAF